MLLEQLKQIEQNITIPSPSEMLVLQVSHIVKNNPSQLERFLRNKKGELLIGLDDIYYYKIDPHCDAAIFVKEQFEMLETILTWAMIDGFKLNMDFTSNELEEIRKTPLFVN